MDENEDAKAMLAWIDRNGPDLALLQRAEVSSGEECALWRKATGWDDPEALDSFLGRAGLESHFKVLQGLWEASTRERDGWKARSERLENALRDLFKASAPYVIQSSPNVFVRVRSLLAALGEKP